MLQRHNPQMNFSLKKKNKVYFHNKNFKTLRKNKKLDSIKDSPFVIEEVLGKNNAKFQLLFQVQVHWVFHVFFLFKIDSFIPV